MDEARFGTHSKLGHGWFPKGIRSQVKVKLGFQNFYVYSAIEPSSGEIFSLILPKVNSESMTLFLGEMATYYGNETMTIVMDGAGWHKSKKLIVPESMSLIYLPPYTPELNPVERFWLQLKRITIRNKIYDTLQQLEQAVCDSLNSFPSSEIAQICAFN